MLGMMILSRVIGGGMALARAELTGPSLSRLKPKLQETALALWGLYLALTLLEFGLLWTIGGMDLSNLSKLPEAVRVLGASSHHQSPRRLIKNEQINSKTGIHAAVECFASRKPSIW